MTKVTGIAKLLGLFLHSCFFFTADVFEPNRSTPFLPGGSGLELSRCILLHVVRSD